MYYGSRQITWYLRRLGYEVGCKRVWRLMAIMDWFTCKVLSWRLSNTMEAEFCIEALRDALMRYDTPEIFNTDQGSQFTTPRFTGILGTSDPYQHGRAWALAGQRVHRASVAVAEMRMYLPARVRDWIGTTDRACQMDCALQRTAAPFSFG